MKTETKTSISVGGATGDDDEPSDLRRNGIQRPDHDRPGGKIVMVTGAEPASVDYSVMRTLAELDALYRSERSDRPRLPEPSIPPEFSKLKYALSELPKSAITPVLRDGGDTYDQMAILDYLKILETEGFERIVDFPTNSGTLALHGRRRDAFLVTVEHRAGRVVNASAQRRCFYGGSSPSRMSFSVGVHLDHRMRQFQQTFPCLEGLRVCLAFISAAADRPSIAWSNARKSVVRVNPSTFHWVNGYPDVLEGIVSTDDVAMAVGGMPLEADLHLARLDAIKGDWRSVLDLDRKRTYVQSCRAAGVRP